MRRGREYCTHVHLGRALRRKKTKPLGMSLASYRLAFYTRHCTNMVKHCYSTAPGRCWVLCPVLILVAFIERLGSWALMGAVRYDDAFSFFYGAVPQGEKHETMGYGSVSSRFFTPFLCHCSMHRRSRRDRYKWNRGFAEAFLRIASTGTLRDAQSRAETSILHFHYEESSIGPHITSKNTSPARIQLTSCGLRPRIRHTTNCLRSYLGLIWVLCVLSPTSAARARNS